MPATGKINTDVTTFFDYFDMVAISFDVDWFNPLSNLVERMYLRFFTEDNTIEILTDHSTFLKRIHYPDITIHDLFIGNSISM